MRFEAKWIWKKQADQKPRHQTVLARKEFSLKGQPREAVSRVAVDGAYRLIVNDRIVADGPARSYPRHFQYDEHDLQGWLQPGRNRVEIIARHWQTGEFHSIPQQAGLLAQIDLRQADGTKRVIASGADWQVAEARAWLPDTAKLSVQQEPQEVYDARRAEPLRFSPAQVLCDAAKGPWKGLNPRDVALMTRKPMFPERFAGARRVDRRERDLRWCVATYWLIHPGLVEANFHSSGASAIASVLTLKRPATVHFECQDYRLAVDGRHLKSGRYKLSAGRHFVLALVGEPFGMMKEKIVRVVDAPKGIRFSNPLDEKHENPWCFIDMPDWHFVRDDIEWFFHEKRNDADEYRDAYYKERDRLLRQVRDLDSFREQLAPQARLVKSEDMYLQDSHWLFEQRRPLADARDLVEDPAALMADNAAACLVRPDKKADVEIALDLGVETCGYFDFELEADEGCILDIYATEYVRPDGVMQHTESNRNGMRYICRQGTNRFTSLKRRAGRYFFLTLRNQTRPVAIRKFNVIESTYPVQAIGSFQASDPNLGRIYEISARTLKLCMEDTFVDCPLYEQVHWVGDARNEALFNYPCFGATDIVRRCLRQGAQSMDVLPMVGCQIPSSWDCILPAWAFLWNLAIWDYYFYSGDKDFLREIWPAALANLQAAEGYLNEGNLFDAPLWNLFDWAGIDYEHDNVLHNSLFFVGAIDATRRVAEVLGRKADHRRLGQLRGRIVRAINATWDEKRGAYPDAILPDGTPSTSVSQHTSFLALLYDVIQKRHAESAEKNLTNPPKGMVPIGSPFAILYYYEALEKLGHDRRIMDSIYEAYLPMLREGATTVWEVFAGSPVSPPGFPTRSHSHAWSSAPVYFLPRIVLGLRPTAPGGRRYTVSPRPGDLEWAQGRTATAHGPLAVAWERNGKQIDIKVRAPKGVQVEFQTNPELKGLRCNMQVETASDDLL